MTEKQANRVGDPGMIIPKRHYDATPGIIFISIEKIIDRYYKDEKKDYEACKEDIHGVDHICLHMERVMVFLEGLKHCDEPLDPYVEENDAEAESPAKKQNVR